MGVGRWEGQGSGGRRQVSHGHVMLGWFWNYCGVPLGYQFDKLGIMLVSFFFFRYESYIISKIEYDLKFSTNRNRN